MFTRWQPSLDVRSEFGRLQEEMDRLFNRWGVTGRSAVQVFPPVNLWEDENNLYVETELPGLDLNDLEIYVTGENQLSVKGQRKQPDTARGTWHRQERGHGSFSRVVELPSLVTSDAVSAELKNGVLLITLPKREEARPRRIEVKGS